MSVTVRVTDNERVRLTANTVEPKPSDRLEFSVKGRITVTEALLDRFEGATLNPVRVAVSGDDTEPVEIDLTASTTLRLDTVDVGIATPDREDVANGLDALRQPADDGSGPTDAQPDVIAVTVEGTIRNVPAATLERLANDDPGIESVTFAVEEPLRSDGGSGDVIFELTLLGYGIVVHRDGTIVVGSDEGLASIDLP